MGTETVDLPADPRLKKLAHDVVADGNEYAVPMLIDFYKALAELDAEDHASRSDFRVNDPESDVPAEKWGDIIRGLARDGPITKHSGSTDTYTFEAAGNDE